MTQAKKPHIHAELIKAWADGATIQLYSGDDWTDLTDPSWDSGLKYRIKPEPIKTGHYRRWISKVSIAAEGFEYKLHTISEGDYGVDYLHNQSYFVRWIDEDWQEGVVVDA